MATQLAVLGTKDDLDQLRVDLVDADVSFALGRAFTSLRDRQEDGQLETWELLISFGVGVGANAAYDLVKAGIERAVRLGRTSLRLKSDEESGRGFSS